MYTLRQATEQDLEFLYQLHVTTMREYITATWGWHEAWQRDYFLQKWDPTPRQIIQVGGQDAGVVVVSWLADSIKLELIELQPEYQGRGIGTAVIRDIQQKAHDLCLPLTLHVLKANQAAQKLYLRLGFTITAEREERYVMTWLSPDIHWENFHAIQDHHRTISH